MYENQEDMLLIRIAENQEESQLSYAYVFAKLKTPFHSKGETGEEERTEQALAIRWWKKR